MGPDKHCRSSGALLSQYVHYFLGRAGGALVAVETQLMIARNLAYFTPTAGKQFLDQAAGLGRIVNRLIGAIRPRA